MCGIAGAIEKNRTVAPEQLKKMAEAIAYRGPDAEGSYVDDNVGFIHKRLSIIDIKAGNQPMTNEDGSVWIVFNGEIYNYLELRQDLIQKKHELRTYSDTEVVIHAYEEYGADCVKKFNGMWSFAIYDQREKQVFLSRDHFGIKPLYFFSDRERFLFSSEIKAILATGLVEKAPNYRGIQDYIVYQFTMGSKTMFRDIYKLEPGYNLMVDMTTLEVKKSQYWDIQYRYDVDHQRAYFVDQLKFLTEDATRLRMRSDVEVGSYLSGGLDSSSVCCLASQMSSLNSMKVFTGRFAEGPQYDESHYAKIVAQSIGAEYHETVITAQDFLDNIQDIIYFLDEPGAGPGVLPQLMVSKLAAKQLKVVLGGQGGDEIFIGYARYLVAYLEECLKGAIYETADKDKYAVSMESIIPNLPLLKSYQPMLQMFWKEGLFREGDARYFRLIDRSEGMGNLFAPELFKNNVSVMEEFAAVFNREGLSSYINKMTYFDLKASLPALLQVEDRMSMACSIESRLPLLDRRIVELMASIPPNIKFSGGESKSLFKEAMRNVVPTEIVNRKDKMGFPVPLAQWYKGELKEFVRSVLLDGKARSRDLYQQANIEKMLETDQPFSRVVWGLLCLELWFQRFIDC